ncbi:hypothetical protein JHK87_035514 [Glycine soja]|nr:hypothetical protein JHK87_035514 [Glycine soja]
MSLNPWPHIVFGRGTSWNAGYMGSYVVAVVSNDLMACGASRYADTNLEAEKKEYIDHIEIIVQWMGWKPFKITYTNDYFQELYELAVELIKKGHAYVDHQEDND